jgi:hypothetical protein
LPVLLLARGLWLGGGWCGGVVAGSRSTSSAIIKEEPKEPEEE